MSNDNEESVSDINHDYLQDSSFSENIEDAKMGTNNNNNSPSNDMISDSSNFISTNENGNDALREHDLKIFVKSFT